MGDKTTVHVVTNESENEAIRSAIEDLGGVPKTDLRELLEDMREVQGIANYYGNAGREGAFKECADKLEELIDG